MLAHLLTTLRLLLALPVAYAMATPDWLAPIWLCVFITLAIVSDVLDGRIARRQGTASSAGQIFDHTTDCIFVSSGLAGAAWAGLVTPLLPPLILIAFAQYVLDSRFLHRHKALRMSFIGRWNGILYFVPMVILALAGLGWAEPLAKALYGLAVVCAWILVISTTVSIIDRALASTVKLTD
jgi:phosphatidylglycerophosphate synthase